MDDEAFMVTARQQTFLSPKISIAALRLRPAAKKSRQMREIITDGITLSLLSKRRAASTMIIKRGKALHIFHLEVKLHVVVDMHPPTQ